MGNQQNRSCRWCYRIGLCAILGCCGIFTAMAQDKKEEPKKPVVYEDKDYGFKLTEPDGWSAVPNSAIRISGEVRKAWSPNDMTSIVAFMQKPGMAMTPRALLDSSVSGMKDGLKGEIKEQEIRDMAGMRAMSMIVVADGTGGALTGQGPVKTLQHWVAVPREKDIVILLLTTPESEHTKHKAAFEAVLKSLQVSGQQSDEQKASK